MRMKKKIKCCSCNKELKPNEVFKSFTDSKYYHNYHRTYTKVVRWCEACWLNNEKKNEDYTKADQERLLEEIKKINPEAYKKIKKGL